MLRVMKNFIVGNVKKMGRLFLLIHVGIWFTAGAVLAYLFAVVPVLNRIECLKNPLDVGSFTALVIGFAGGVFWLMRQEPEEKEAS